MAASGIAVRTLYMPEQVNAPVGTRVGWWPPLNEPQILLWTGVTVGPDAEEFSMYPDPEAGWSWIRWDRGPRQGEPGQYVWGQNYELISDFLEAHYPADDQGKCTGMWPPFPLTQWKTLTGCLQPLNAITIPNSPPPYHQAMINTWQDVVATTQAVNPSVGAQIASGRLPFVKWTNVGASHLNGVQGGDTVDGVKGTWRRDNVGLYYDGNGHTIAVRAFEYFDRANGGGFGDYWSNPFGVVLALLDQIADIVKDLGCSSAATIAVSALNQGNEATSILAGLCPRGTTVDNTSDFPMTWVLIGVGTLAAAGLTVLGLKKRKHKS